MSALYIIIIAALLFDFINGFHDTANVVATAVATRALSPYQAVTIAAIFNFFGAFMGTSVAITIGSGLIDPTAITHITLLAALLSAISWNLVTWSLGIPSSSTHALIGSLIGGAIMNNHGHDIHFYTIFNKVVLPMLCSPVLAFCLSLLVFIAIAFCLSKNRPRKYHNFIRELQVMSSALLAFAHGSNDAQKTMSIIALALFNFNIIANFKQIPLWVITTCAVVMAIGTLSGGMKIIKTLSTRVAKLRPANGLAAELSAGLLILAASHLGLPVSTTHAASGAIMGGGYLESHLNVRVIRAMIIAWTITLPVCCMFSAVLFILLRSLYG